MSDIQIIVTISTIVVAVIGAVLGVINTIHGLRKDKVKLKVRPCFMAHQDNILDVKLCVNVVNLSSFSVTIAVVGYIEKDSKSLRAAIMVPGPISTISSIPHRLSSREDILVDTHIELINDSILQVDKVFATTACNKTVMTRVKLSKNQLMDREKLKKQRKA
jgi:hypothetical protein